MGNILKTVQGRLIVVEDIPIPPMRDLTKNQINIIKTTWEIPAARPVDTGEKILYTFLDRYPHNQLKFAAFRNTPIIMLKGTPGFRSHANKIMNIFGIAVDCLGKEGGLEEIERELTEMGKSHRRRGIPKKAFVELRVIIIEILTESCRLDPEGQEAWSHLIDIVYHIIFTNLII